MTDPLVWAANGERLALGRLAAEVLLDGPDAKGIEGSKGARTPDEAPDSGDKTTAQHKPKDASCTEQDWFGGLPKKEQGQEGDAGSYRENRAMQIVGNITPKPSLERAPDHAAVLNEEQHTKRRIYRKGNGQRCIDNDQIKWPEE